VSTTTVYLDVSDLLRHGLTSGIQRVVRQVVPRIVRGADDDLELRMLRFDQAGHTYEELDTASMLEVLANRADAPVVLGHRELASFGPGDVFLDLDSAWNSPLKRSTLYPVLKAAGVTIVSYLYDLVPLKVPEVVAETTSANWIVYLSSVLAWSDLVMTDSRCAERDFLEVKKELGVQRHIPTLVTRLGSDLPEVDEPTPEERSLMVPLEGAPFLLFVGTIEPRKDHLLAVRAFDQLSVRFPDAHLVLAGRNGWSNSATVKAITEHPQFGRRIHWIQSPSDALLTELYRRATLNLYFSRYEGFGLPIAESLSHGRVTIASRNSSMYEVARDACDYTWHNTVSEVVETVAQYLGDRDLLAAREQHIRESFRPLDWDTVAATIDTALRGLGRAAELRLRRRPNQLQLVYISNNLGKLQRAIPLWDTRGAALVKEYVVVAPPHLLEDIRAIPSRVPVVAIDESRILAGREEEFRLADHVHKNWMLRSGLVDLDEVGDVFVMLDDDNLPLGQVDISAFIDDEGHHVAHYFYDLIQWAHRVSDFDEGQRASAAALSPHGFELLSYSSHQPQVIDKALFREAVEWARRTQAPANVCEWNIYFNHSITRYPTLFSKRVFRTLNWPGRATDWSHAYAPQDLVFENFYSKSYSMGLFRGLSVSDRANLKLERKRSELAPFERSIAMHANSADVIHRNELAHGLIRFDGGDFAFLVAGLPQLITVAEGSSIRLTVSWQIHGPGRARHHIGLSYRVDGGPVRITRIRRRGDAPERYETGIASIPVSARGAGLHEVEFFLQLDGEPVAAYGIRYLAVLVVVGPREIPRRYFEQLASPRAWREVTAQRPGARLVDRVAPGRAERHARQRALSHDVASLHAAVDRVPDAVAELQVLQREVLAESADLRRRLTSGSSALMVGLVDRAASSPRSAAVHGLAEVGADPEPSLARARAIEEHLGRVVGKRILVVGSAFGYLPMYFAERGAKAVGWEPDSTCADVARDVARVTGSSVVLGHVEDLDTRLEAVEPATFDVAIIDPSLAPGSVEVERWAALLADRVPVLIRDGAAGAAQVEDERTRVLGRFSWAEETRPLVVRTPERHVTVSGHEYPYDRVTAESYRGSPMARRDRMRRYYFHAEYVVKEYHFDRVTEEELRQPLREIDVTLNALREAEVWHAALLADFEFSSSWVRIVYRAVKGDLVHDLAPIGVEAACRMAYDVLRTLGDLGGLGLHHNDVRSWNVMLGSEGAWLIDYGLTWTTPSESAPIALLWALHAALTGEPESSEVGKSELPAREVFARTPLEALYDSVAEGEEDWNVLLKTVPDGSGRP
jgi:glycosyltransferase involved in cell wall biosynthesis/tRNA A-37 threonylcarbamoyl transferase component Bud32